MMSPVLRLSRALSHAMNAPSVLATRAEVERKLATGRVVLFDVRDVDEIVPFCFVGRSARSPAHAV